MFDIGAIEHLLFLSPFFLEKKRYLVHLSFVYLSLILSMNQVERLRFWVPRSPEWIGSFPPTK